MSNTVLFVVFSPDVVDPYGISLLSAVARRAGWTVELAEFKTSTIDDVFKRVRPAIVAYSVMSSYVEQYLRINAFLKSRYEFTSIMGGAHPTYFPEVVEQEGIDYVCRGEGDMAFEEFLTKFAAGEDTEHIANLWSKTHRNDMRPVLTDLDSLPLPDREMLFDRLPVAAQSPYKTFMPSRGCPYSCSYCHNGAMVAELRGKGPIVRTCGVQHLIAEISAVMAKYPLRFIKFMDDLFAANTSWLREFASAYPRDIGVPFTCCQRLESITPERLALLKQAGCQSISLSLDNIVPRIRNDILGRCMKLSNEDIRKRFLMIKEHGINVLSNVILGVPTSTTQDAVDTIDFYVSGQVDFAQATILVPYPRTPIWEYCKTRGILGEQGETASYGFTQALSTLTCFTRKEKEVQWNFLVFYPAMAHWPKLRRMFLWMALHLRPNPLSAVFFIFVKGYLYAKYIFPAKGAARTSLPVFLKTLRLEVRRMMGKDEQSLAAELA